MSSRPYTIIIPVKPVAIGKSRLRASGPFSDALVTAIALDTIEAVRRAGYPVLVVTDDEVVSREASALGAAVEPDKPDAGLNPAIGYGEGLLRPDSGRAALTSDLPALRPAEIRAALAAVEVPDRRAFVADHTGTGTTMLIAPPGVPLDPRFGGPSAAAHAASGAISLAGSWPTLRLDVDTAADLTAAAGLGLGARTAEALRSTGAGRAAL